MGQNNKILTKKNLFCNYIKKIGQNFVILAHSEKGNLPRIIFDPFYGHYGPKIGKIWLEGCAQIGQFVASVL
jgi:hypothetical protein